MMIPLFILQVKDDEDRELLTEYFLQYRFTSLRIARAILHDPDLAEDAMQDTFLRLTKHIKTVRPNPLEVRSFLATITRHCAYDILKKRKPDLSWDDLVYEPADDSVNVEDTVIENNEMERIAQTLPIIYSTVFLLRYLQDFSTRNIAAYLDISEDAVRKRLQRAKEMIMDDAKKKGVTYNA